MLVGERVVLGECVLHALGESVGEAVRESVEDAEAVRQAVGEAQGEAERLEDGEREPLRDCVPLRVMLGETLVLGDPLGDVEEEGHSDTLLHPLGVMVEVGHCVDVDVALVEKVCVRV